MISLPVTSHIFRGAKKHIGWQNSLNMSHPYKDFLIYCKLPVPELSDSLSIHWIFELNMVKDQEAWVISLVKCMCMVQNAKCYH